MRISKSVQKLQAHHHWTFCASLQDISLSFPQFIAVCECGNGYKFQTASYAYAVDVPESVCKLL